MRLSAHRRDEMNVPLNVVRGSVFWMRLVRSFHWQESVKEIVVLLFCDIYGVMDLCDIYGILVNDNNPVSLLCRIWLQNNIKYGVTFMCFKFTAFVPF